MLGRVSVFLARLIFLNQSSDLKHEIHINRDSILKRCHICMYNSHWLDKRKIVSFDGVNNALSSQERIGGGPNNGERTGEIGTSSRWHLAQFTLDFQRAPTVIETNERYVVKPNANQKLIAGRTRPYENGK